MTLLNIVQFGPEELRHESTPLQVPSQEVVHFDDGLQEIVRDLTETLFHYKIAVGLAAPQVGIQKRIAVVNLKGESPMETIVLVNPAITSSSGKKVRMKESCMSVPHFRGEVERRYKLHVVFQDRIGMRQELDATGFLARAIAHEVDHLNGILYTTRMDKSAELEPVDFFRR